MQDQRELQEKEGTEADECSDPSSSSSGHSQEENCFEPKVEFKATKELFESHERVEEKRSESLAAASMAMGSWLRRNGIVEEELEAHNFYNSLALIKIQTPDKLRNRVLSDVDWKRAYMEAVFRGISRVDTRT